MAGGGGGGGSGGGVGFGSGLNGNQQNVANALVNFFNTNGGIPAIFGALTPFGLTMVSGESATGSQQTTFNAMSQFMGLLTDPFIAVATRRDRRRGRHAIRRGKRRRQRLRGQGQAAFEG